MKKLGVGCRAAASAALAAAVLLAVAPTAAAEPAVQLSESTGLTPGQAITVNLTGLPAGMPTVAVGQCKPTIVAPTDCNLGGSLLGTADAQGVWQPAKGNTITLVASVGGTDCTAAAGACTISVTSLTDASRILASAPLDFGPKAQPTVTSTAAAADSDDDDSNTGLVVGIVAAGVAVLAALTAVVLRRRRKGA